MTRSVIDPITRIEGHLRVEMEVTNGKVSDAWVSGGCFRGMELVVEGRTPEDAAQIVQRICGVCPVSHSHASTIAAEKAYGIEISNNARIIRNLIEGAQFLHSHILWFYNLAALDYVNPLNALDADVADAYALAQEAKHVHEQRPRRAQGAPEEVRRQRAAVHLLGQLVPHEEPIRRRLERVHASARGSTSSARPTTWRP